MEPAVVLELGGDVAGPGVDAAAFQLLEPPVPLGLGQSGAAPGTEADDHAGCAAAIDDLWVAIVDDQRVLLEFRSEADQRVRAGVRAGMGVASPVHLAGHRLTAVRGHDAIMAGDPNSARETVRAG